MVNKTAGRSSGSSHSLDSSLDWHTQAHGAGKSLPGFSASVTRRNGHVIRAADPSVDHSRHQGEASYGMSGISRPTPSIQARHATSPSHAMSTSVLGFDHCGDGYALDGLGVINCARPERRGVPAIPDHLSGLVGSVARSLRHPSREIGPVASDIGGEQTRSQSWDVRIKGAASTRRGRKTAICGIGISPCGRHIASSPAWLSSGKLAVGSSYRSRRDDCEPR